MTNILELSNVSKNFSQAGQKIEIIKNADFSIKSSEFLSLIGPSGSGKTTLLQICGMLDNPSSGAVIINGENMAKANDEKRTKIRKMNIGFIYQFHHLLPEFSALENVALPLLIQDINKVEAYQKAKEILERRKKNEPLAYILGNWDFRKLTLAVGPGVLIPRPETEELVGSVLEYLKKNSQKNFENHLILYKLIYSNLLLIQ